MRRIDGDVLLLLHALDHAVDELVDLLGGHLLQTLLPIFVEQLAGFERLADGFAEIFEGVVAVEFGEARVGVLEAGVEQVVGEGLEQVVHLDLGGEVAGVFGVADALHASA